LILIGPETSAVGFSGFSKGEAQMNLLGFSKRPGADSQSTQATTLNSKLLNRGLDSDARLKEQALSQKYILYQYVDTGNLILWTLKN